MSVKERKMKDADNNRRWRKENMKRIFFYLNKTGEEDVIEHLEKQPNKRQYLIGLIREDMKK